ncbi:hypothetical protein Pan44_24940 [Caulifigura coniformis]|uniref:Uncharacterized protein n=1 Tax=Caulifigura coniformis TaxID=2527983 RepID=A0A517SEC0_9PLAN|nr:hypothetical protein [Caulifigura coniformis]QDT54461.1 hypothetical protein Pan44_24940 [Caulifigura coniformis]
MPADQVPQFRTYRHARCQQETIVAGQSFEVVSNPMSSMERTFCTPCGAMFPIEEFAWVDSGETISDYYARHSASATPLQRTLCSKSFMVALIAVAAVATSIGTSTLVANNDLFTRIMIAAGGFLIGAFIGMAIFLSGFANPIKRQVCGVEDTRRLT